MTKANAFGMHRRPAGRVGAVGACGKPLPKRDAFLYHLARLILGYIFLSACYEKILHPQVFAEVISNYQVLPERLIHPVAVMLPWVELIVGLSLLLNIFLQGATVLSNLLLLTFFLVLLFNLARGLDVTCGCFSTQPTEKGAGIFTVLRDLSFLCVSGYLFYAQFFTAQQASGQSGKKRF